MQHHLPFGLTTLAALGALAPLGAAHADEHWPSWRGPDMNGVARSERAPVKWSEEQNIRWKVAVPGVGSSTPIVWGDTLYVTTAIETDRMPEGAAPEPEPAPQPEAERGRGGRGGRGGDNKPKKIHEFAVIALDRKDGSIKWQTKVAETVPHESIHSTNTQASASPITDGEHIIAFFGSRGLHCLDMTGKVLWSKDLGKMQTRNEFGEGASPALHEDTVVVVWDHEGDDFIAAYDKATGKEKWKQERKEVTSWATPLIVPVGERMQVIATATDATRAYDLETGELVWWLGGMTTNCIPTPILHEGIVYIMSGFRGAALQAIRLADAKGDLTESAAVVWRHGQETSYVPSGVLIDGHIHFLRNNTGVLSCLDAATGEVKYSGQKLTDARTMYSSLTSVGENIYAPSREGYTAVFKAGPEFEEVAVNFLDDTFDASPVIVDNELYLRGWKHLYCIAEQAE